MRAQIRVHLANGGAGLNVTLLGFVRGHTFNIYSAPTRITG